jgi:hypothetical protein
MAHEVRADEPGAARDDHGVGQNFNSSENAPHPVQVAGTSRPADIEFTATWTGRGAIAGGDKVHFAAVDVQWPSAPAAAIPPEKQLVDRPVKWNYSDLLHGI